MADQQDNVVQPPTTAEHDGWEVHSASAVDQPKPEEIIERLTDVPGDEQVEQKAAKAAREEKFEQGDQPVTPEQKKGKSASQRNDELKTRIAAETKAYHDARRAREFEQAEIVRLRQEREALQREPEAQAAKPQWAKYEEDGKSYEEFLDDRAEYDRQRTIQLTRKELEDRERAGYERARQAQHQRTVEQFARAHQERISQAAEKYPDFHELVNNNLSDIEDNAFLTDVIQHHQQGAELLYHLAQNPDEARVLSGVLMSQTVGTAIAKSQQPVELLSYFAQNPAQLDALNQMGKDDALTAFGELKAQILAAKHGSARSEISNAKPPIRPVGGGRSSTPKSSDDLPFGPEWIKRENQRDREKKKTSAYF